MSDGTATLYVDRTNPFTLTFTKNDELLPLAEMEAIVKFELRYKSADDSVGLYYNSVDYPEAFVINNATAQVKIKPVTFGWGKSSKKGDTVEVLVYDSGDSAEGHVWSQITLIVKDDAVLLVTIP